MPRPAPATLFAASLGLAIAGAAQAMEPGQWTASNQITDIDLPGEIPPQIVDMVRRQISERATDVSTCITQEDLDNAPERIFRESQGQCAYESFSMEGGRLEAVAQCTTGEGTMNMTMSGTYTDDTYQMNMQLRGDMGMGEMTMTSSVTGQRTGPCT